MGKQLQVGGGSRRPSTARAEDAVRAARHREGRREAVKEALLEAGTHECDGCPGTGVYHGRGYVENGKFIGFQGTCFRCQGKGYQTDADVRRNRYYDDRVRRIRP